VSEPKLPDTFKFRSDELDHLSSTESSLLSIALHSMRRRSIVATGIDRKGSMAITATSFLLSIDRRASASGPKQEGPKTRFTHAFAEVYVPLGLYYSEVDGNIVR
jgi:hypothetical protein